MEVHDLVDIAELERKHALDSINPKTQSTLGQFFTPAPAARLIASMIDFPDQEQYKILDPGAGSGILSAALIERLLREKPNAIIHVTAVERDPAMIPFLTATLHACEQLAPAQVSTQVLEADYILDSTGLDSTLNFQAEFDIVIENPPYGKISNSSPHRKALQAYGLDTPNLYAAFLALSIDTLKSGGTLVAITPRSFFNGPYFGSFRKRLLRSLTLNKIHVFDSRSTVFNDTGVLQENVIFAASKNTPQGKVTLSVSHDHLGDQVQRHVAYTEVVRPNDPHQFIRLATSEEDTEIAEKMLTLPCSLTDLGITVSTGKVVDFRSKESLSFIQSEDGHPLVYPVNIKNGTVTWPIDGRKPQWFIPASDKENMLLLPEGWYTVVKRFSSKEERRRIVAATWSPIVKPGSVAFENHLNVFHTSGVGLDQDLAHGLTAWLNSTFVDRYFRMFSGHTQVNATDLKTLRFPSTEDLRKLSKESDGTTESIDLILKEKGF